VRPAGSGGRYTGRSSATRAESTRIERDQPIRSAITVAGILGYACSSSRTRGSTASTTDPAGLRSYLGGPALRHAAFTVFLEIPSTRAISEIGIFSARRSRRTSAQFSTESTPSSSDSGRARVIKKVVRFQMPRPGQFSGAVDRRQRPRGCGGRTSY